MYCMQGLRSRVLSVLLVGSVRDVTCTVISHLEGGTTASGTEASHYYYSNTTPSTPSSSPHTTILLR